ncbi:MAG: arylsulfatase [Planctomycetales bacterium]|nr:arylsulfatase [Planctomycetales bacterium]
MLLSRAALLRQGAKAEMMNRIRLIVCLLVWQLFAFHAQAATRPNIVLILADDLGYSDLGCYGGEIETPNLNALAAGGIRYTQFYNTARCWPTRCALLTGYYPQQVGRDALPNVPGGARGGRPDWAILLPQMLKPQGYRSYLSGKWHIDGKPIAQGFDHAYTMDDHNRFFYPQNTTLDDVEQPPIARDSNYYQTTAITSHAIECLQEHATKFADQPFFHYVAYTCPHFPLHAPADDIAKYRGRYGEGWDVIRNRRWQRLGELGLVSGALSALEREIGPPYRHFSDPAKLELGPREVDGELPWAELTEEQREFQSAKMEIHAAMVDRMDQEIGRLIEQLKTMNQLENTLVIFLSDNGASAEIMIRGDGHNPDAPLGSAESYLCLGPGWSSAANTPFRRHKTWVHEGGTSTPLIAHWPAGISARGELRHQVGHVIDIAPTVVELAGGQWPTKADNLGGGNADVPSPPGQSLVPSLNSDTPEPRIIWWLHEGNRALRDGDFKLVAAKDEPWQLYDMRQDRAESSNLITGMPEKAKELEEKWNRITAEFEQMAKRRR